MIFYVTFALFTNCFSSQLLGAKLQCHDFLCNINSEGAPVVVSTTSLDPKYLPVIDADSKTSTAVSIDDLLRQLVVPGNGSKYGIVIFEAGSDTEVQWRLMSPDQSVTIAGLSSSEPPMVQTALDQTIPIYSFESTEYTVEPKGLVVVSPSTSLSFRLLLDLDVKCRDNALVFAVVHWTEDVSIKFPKDINFVVPSQCETCTSLRLSSDWIRFCPYITTRTIETTTSVESSTATTTVLATQSASKSTTTSSISTTVTTTETPSTTLSTSTLTTTEPQTTTDQKTTTAAATTSVPATSGTLPEHNKKEPTKRINHVVFTQNKTKFTEKVSGTTSTNHSIDLSSYRRTTAQIPERTVKSRISTASTTGSKGLDTTSWMQNEDIQSTTGVSHTSGTIKTQRNAINPTSVITQLVSTTNARRNTEKTMIHTPTSSAKPHFRGTTTEPDEKVEMPKTSIQARTSTSSTFARTFSTFPEFKTSSQSIGSTTVSELGREMTGEPGYSPFTSLDWENADALNVESAIPPIKAQQTSNQTKTTFHESTRMSSVSELKEDGVQILLTNDLFGMTVKCNGDSNLEPGLIDCSLFIDAAPHKLGEGAVCIREIDGLTVRFGKSPTVIIGDHLRITGCGPTDQNWAAFSSSLTGVIKSSGETNFPSFFVVYPSEVMSCQETVTVEVKQVTGNGNRDLLYEWGVVNGSSVLPSHITTEKSRTLTFPRRLIYDSTTLFVRGCNFGGRCTEKRDIHIKVVKEKSVFTAKIIGVPKMAVPSSLIRLHAVAELVSCNASVNVPNEVQYIWYLNDNVVSYEDNIRIAPFSYFINDSLLVHLSATYLSTDRLHEAKTHEDIQFYAEPLTLSIDARAREIPVDVNLVVDASGSRDHNSVAATLKHSWTCLTIPTSKKCNLGSDIIWDRQQLIIPANSLQKGQRYNFTDNIVSSNKLRGTVYSVVTVTEAQLPFISIRALKEDQQRVDDFIRVQALVTSARGPLTATWTVVKSNNTAWFNISHFLTQTSFKFQFGRTSKNNQVAVSLTIPPQDTERYPNWAGLSVDSKYLVRLTAANPLGDTHADVLIKTLSPPRTGSIEVKPMKGLIGLTTPVTFSVGDGWEDNGDSLLYRFGLKVHLVNNNSDITWLQQSAAKEIRTYLPSAWPSPAACEVRLGYSALLEVCDLDDACTTTESAPFTVAFPSNITVATNNIVSVVKADVINGNLFAACHTMSMLDLELCEKDIDVVAADKLTLALLRSLDSKSEVSEYREVLEATSESMNFVSDNVLSEFIGVLGRYRSLLSTHPYKLRKKRSADATVTQTTEKEATTMLEMYDILLGKNQQIIDVFMMNIVDFLAGFCLQLDSSTSRIMKAQGSKYTHIQAQSVTPSTKNFLDTSYSVAGSTKDVLTFDSSFQSMYRQYECGSSVVCNHVCLATARIDQTALKANTHLVEQLFSSQFNSVEVNRTTSALYKFGIVDPQSGQFLTGTNLNQAAYSIKVPVEGYKRTNYYACLLFLNNMWDGTSCVASDFATTSGNIDYIHCYCSATGLLGVFTTSPPSPPPVPSHNEIEITFNLSSKTGPTSSQLASFASKLSIESGQEGRLVSGQASSEKTGAIIKIVLRPPFLTQHQTNSYALQSIQRAVSSGSGFKAYEDVTVVDTSYKIVMRNLTGDGNARKVVVHMDRSFPSVVGNNSDAIATKWSQSLAKTLNISPYRIKNAKLFTGIVFNFTITRPFEDEKYPLSAEEISLMVLECTHYKELILKSVQDESITVPELTKSNLVELRVITQSNTLVLVLVIVISTVLILSSLYIGGAIVVKVRTDRLIEEERKRMIFVDPHEVAPPQVQYVDSLQPSMNNPGASRVTRTTHR